MILKFRVFLRMSLETQHSSPQAMQSGILIGDLQNVVLVNFVDLKNTSFTKKSENLNT